MNQEQPRFLYTQDGLSLFWRGQQYSIGRSHPAFEQIIQVLADETWEDLDGLLDVRKAVIRQLGPVSVSDTGEVTFDGRPIHNTLSRRIFEFMSQGLPWKPLARFLENLMANPSRRAVQELYNFLENKGIAITPDGHFLAYKGVTDTFKDVYTKKFNNAVGQIHSIPRNEVDDDCSRDCSYGFHVGSHEYATKYATTSGKVMLVKVNPADAVSVPTSDAEKLRVCRYEVVELAPHAPLQEPLVMAYADTSEYDEDEEYEEWEEDPWDDQAY